MTGASTEAARCKPSISRTLTLFRVCRTACSRAIQWPSWRATRCSVSAPDDLSTFSTSSLDDCEVLGFRPLAHGSFTGLLFVRVPSLQQSTAVQQVLEPRIRAGPGEVVADLLVRVRGVRLDETKDHPLTE